MKIVLTLQILHSALELPRICVALFKSDPHEKRDACKWKNQGQEWFLYEHFKSNLLISTILYRFYTVNLLCREKVTVFLTLWGPHISQKCLSMMQYQMSNKHLPHLVQPPVYFSPLSSHTLSTLTEEIVPLFGIRTTCTSANRKHNSVLMCDNRVICFCNLHSTNT